MCDKCSQKELDVGENCYQSKKKSNLTNYFFILNINKRSGSNCGDVDERGEV